MQTHESYESAMQKNSSRSGGKHEGCRKILGLTTADHKVLNEEQESGLHHRCAVVVQDLATQCIQSCPCKTKSAQETQRSLISFLRPEKKNPDPLILTILSFF